MADLWNEWGGDLVIAATGDLGMATGTDLSNQRILRRLLSNPGDYIWQLSYGAGLGAQIGQPASIARLRATIRSQIFKEPSVARSPEPIIDLQYQSSQAGLVFVTITYFQLPGGTTQVLSFPLGS